MLVTRPSISALSLIRLSSPAMKWSHSVSLSLLYSSIFTTDLAPAMLDTTSPER